MKRIFLINVFLMCFLDNDIVLNLKGIQTRGSFFVQKPMGKRESAQGIGRKLRTDCGHASEKRTEDLRSVEEIISDHLDNLRMLGEKLTCPRYRT